MPDSEHPKFQYQPVAEYESDYHLYLQVSSGCGEDGQEAHLLKWAKTDCMANLR